MEEVEAMVAEIDIDGNGEVDFEEFLQVMAGQAKATYTKRELLRAFRLFADPQLPTGSSPGYFPHTVLSAVVSGASAPQALSRQKRWSGRW